MFEYLAKTFVRLSILSAVVSSLFGIGLLIDSYLPWNYLTYFFVFVRHLLLSADWFIDVDALINVISVVYFLKISLWLYSAVRSMYSSFID